MSEDHYDRLSRIRGLKGGGRISNYLARQADYRRSSPTASLSRRVFFEGQGVVPMYWWSGAPNFGDALSPEIVKAISKSRPQWVHRAAQGKLMAVGSIAHAVNEGDAIWGSGLLEERVLSLPRGSHAYAVRGPLTADCIVGEKPSVFGDPAMLLPNLYVPDVETVPRKVGVIPHFTEVHHERLQDSAWTVIDPGNSWRDVVDAICSCELVFASSLHGLIVAEAFRIPAVWIEVSKRDVSTRFKFHDYYLSTDREPPDPIALKSIGRAFDRSSDNFGSWQPEGLLHAWEGVQLHPL